MIYKYEVISHHDGYYERWFIRSFNPLPPKFNINEIIKQSTIIDEESIYISSKAYVRHIAATYNDNDVLHATLHVTQK